MKNPAFKTAASNQPTRDPARMLDTVTREWGGHSDLWIFGYASLIWRPEFEFAEERLAIVHGYHRALKMWSRVNRGTPENPGLVFGLLSGGSCKGMVFRIAKAQVAASLPALWDREMPNGVYDPRWLRCQTPLGEVRALAFTLSKRSPNHTGVLHEDVYRQIFSSSCGRFGTTLDYAQLTHSKLQELGIDDHALGKLLRLARS
ncbi:MAG: ChaC-like protein [Polaromonas sp.]|nr:ChaC-like protein [Polaromonas sp.]